MGFSAHRGSVGHTIGSQIIGKENAGKQSAGEPSVPGQTAVGFSHIHVSPAANGLTVSHTPKGGGIASESAPEEQAHVFRDATEAHHHIGQLLGVRMASGQQKT